MVTFEKIKMRIWSLIVKSTRDKKKFTITSIGHTGIIYSHIHATKKILM